MVILLQLKPEEFRIVDIACGYSHTLLLEQSGTLHLSINRSTSQSIYHSNLFSFYQIPFKGILYGVGDNANLQLGAKLFPIKGSKGSRYVRALGSFYRGPM